MQIRKEIIDTGAIFCLSIKKRELSMDNIIIIFQIKHNITFKS